MGNFYTSIAIKANDLDSIIRFLNKKKRVSFVSKPDNDFIYLYDQECEQNPEQITQLCKEISSEFKCPALAFNNHDDDVLNYWLFVDGKEIDQYDSAPDYFEAAEGMPPKGGDPVKLCNIFDCQNDVEKLGDILHKESFENNSYFFAYARHEMICEILGLNFQLSALSFELIERGDIESKNADEFIEIANTADTH